MEVTINKQLDLWKVGKSRHNIGGGCCPDFSCCFPQLKASESEKMLFCDAWVNRNELKNQIWRALEVNRNLDGFVMGYKLIDTGDYYPEPPIYYNGSTVIGDYNGRGRSASILID